MAAAVNNMNNNTNHRKTITRNKMRERMVSTASITLESAAAAEPEREHSHKNKSKRSKNWWIKWSLAVVLSILLLLLSFYMGKLSQTFGGSKSSKSSEKSAEIKVHWAGEEVLLHIPRDKNRDACDLLSDCFQSQYFLPDPINSPSNPYKACYSTLKYILKSYDSGFMFEGDRLVGFISSDIENGAKIHAPFSRISYYNVCIRKEDRGRGLAKQLIPEYTKLILDKRIPGETRPAGHRIYAALDVDFDTDMAIGAFALYAKMGFNRWWEPCSTIGTFDFNKLERQISLANPKQDQNKEKSPSLMFPMSQYILRRQASLRKQIAAGPNVLSHFCMVKLLEEDDFGMIGRDIKSQVESALRVKKLMKPANGKARL